MLLPVFKSAKILADKIDAYFISIEGEYSTFALSLDDRGNKAAKEKPECIRQPEPATIAGLAFFLGFSSLQQFNNYQTSGKFANALKRGRLRVEASYEKKLHHQSPAGAIFALKSMGWNEKPEDKTSTNDMPHSLNVEVFETGPKPAENEKDVILD